MPVPTISPPRCPPQPIAAVAAAALVAFGAIRPGTRAADLAQSAWVTPETTGRLAYRQTATGDRIMDFSHAGYRGGGVALPEVPVKETVRPTGGPDDTAAIEKFGIYLAPR